MKGPPIVQRFQRHSTSGSMSAMTKYHIVCNNPNPNFTQHYNKCGVRHDSKSTGEPGDSGEGEPVVSCT